MIFEDHAKVLLAARETLMAADRIKSDPEYISALGYMRMQKKRGRIEDYPRKENNYTFSMR